VYDEQNGAAAFAGPVESRKGAVFMRFLGLGLADTAPDANTIWTFREALTRARIAGKPAIEVVFARFEVALAAAGFLAMSGQIMDASIIPAQYRRREARYQGKPHPGGVAHEPAKLPEKPAMLIKSDSDRSPYFRSSRIWLRVYRASSGRIAARSVRDGALCNADWSISPGCRRPRQARRIWCNAGG